MKIMNLKIAVILALALPVAGVLRAEDKEKAPAKTEAAPSAFSWDTIRTRLMHLKDGLTSSAVERHYQNKSASAVAAVRGAKQEQFNADQPYWKGGVQAKKARQQKAERSELTAAVDLVLAGKVDEGKKKLYEFEMAHPKSALLKEVRETLEMLNNAPPQEASTAAPAAPAPAGAKSE